MPVDPPDPASLSRSPYLYKALARDGRGSPSGSSLVFGEADTIPLPLDAAVIEVGKTYEEAVSPASTFAALLAAAIFISPLVSAGGAYLLARTALSPVERVVASARTITAGDLSKRLLVRHPKDEVGRLAATVNDLLTRLEAAFARRVRAPRADALAPAPLRRRREPPAEDPTNLDRKLRPDARRVGFRKPQDREGGRRDDPQGGAAHEGTGGRPALPWPRATRAPRRTPGPTT